MSRILKIRLFGIGVLMLVLLVGAAAVVLGPRRLFVGGRQKLERGWNIVTGRLVNVDGHYLRLDCTGKGIPTVVFDAGLAQGRNTWGQVPDGVASFARVITYDRAGLGESDPGPVPRTSEQLVQELHTLLAKAGETGPFVLVGHSLGGLNARLYALRYPDDVAGLVLIDAAHENEYERIAAMLPAPERDKYLQHEGGDNYEQVNLLASAAEIRAAGTLKPMPLVVLSAGRNEWAGNDPARLQLRAELQSSLVRLVPGAGQVIAEQSGHFIQLDQPTMVVSAIRSVVQAAAEKRTSLSLAPVAPSHDDLSLFRPTLPMNTQPLFGEGSH